MKSTDLEMDEDEGGTISHSGRGKDKLSQDSRKENGIKSELENGDAKVKLESDGDEAHKKDDKEKGSSPALDDDNVSEREICFHN